MAKVFRISELVGRKRALVAESEVYRQTLTLEIQNLRLYRARAQRKFAFLRLANPILLVALSLLGSRSLGSRIVRKKRRGKWSRLIGASLMGWRMYRQFGPTIQGILARRRSRTEVRMARNQQNPATLF